MTSNIIAQPQYCVYRTEHPAGFYYIGKSQTNKVLQQKYQGSGTRLNSYFNAEQYHPSTWSTNIIATFDREDDAYNCESKLVTVNTLVDPYCVNDATGGRSGTQRSDLIKQGILSRDCYPALTIQNVKTFDYEIGGKVQPCVDLRMLHQFLAVPTAMNDWFKRRVASYKFIENVEWIEKSAPQKCVAGTQKCGALLPVQNGGQNRKDYIVTLDLAKQLCMVERNDKGTEARVYFIGIEKAYYESQDLKNQTQVDTNKPTLEDICNNQMLFKDMFDLNKLPAMKVVAKSILEHTGVDVSDQIKAYRAEQRKLAK